MDIIFISERIAAYFSHKKEEPKPAPLNSKPTTFHECVDAVERSGFEMKGKDGSKLQIFVQTTKDALKPPSVGIDLETRF